MKKLFICILTAMAIMACSKDDEEKDLNPEEELTYYKLEEPEGAWFVVEGPMGKDTITGDYVSLSGGQLMDQAFYRNYNVYTTKGSFNLRISFPAAWKDNVDPALYTKHSLNTFILSLEESKFIKTPYAELSFSGAYFKKNNASGEVELKNYYKYQKTEYSLLVDVLARVEGVDGNYYEIKGYFWKK